MAFSLTQPGGWCDFPDSTWDGVVTEDHLVELNSLVRFAAVCDEYLVAGPSKNGDAVALAASADDGYNYSRAEALYAWACQASPNPATGTNGGGGNLLFFDQWITQDSGAVQSIVNYYVQGGQETATTDGLLAVLLCCRRGAGNKTSPTVRAGSGGGPAGGGGGTATGGSGSPLPGSGWGGDQGNQGDGRNTCPAVDQLLRAKRWRFGRARVAPASAISAGWYVFGSGRWKRVRDAYTLYGQLQWIWVSGERYHTTTDHWWLRPGGDPSSNADERNWVRQCTLRVGDKVFGGHRVDVISRPHTGEYRELILEPQADGDQSFMMGAEVAHNLITAAS